MPSIGKIRARAQLGKQTLGKKRPEVAKPKAPKTQAPMPATPKGMESQARTHDKVLAKVLNKLGSPLPGLDAEQTKVAKKVLAVGKASGANRKELLSAAMTGLVESSFRNLPGGDRDSSGWRQERAMYYGSGPKGPQNVKAAAKRYFEESRAEGSGAGMTAGQLAQAVQQSGFPDRYEENRAPAKRIVGAFNKRTKLAEKSGIKYTNVKIKGLKPKPGPFSGSRRMVREIVGAKVRGDKEPGHSSGGMHDPSNPNAYAQDIGSAGPNPAEGESKIPYSEQTVKRIARNLRKKGADIPKDFSLGQNWEGKVEGYNIELITQTHGSGPHIHIGAEWAPGSSSSSYVSGGAATGASGASGGVPAPGKRKLKKKRPLISLEGATLNPRTSNESSSTSTTSKSKTVPVPKAPPRKLDL